MKQFIITGFADEISENVQEQICGLQENQISYIELRGLSDKNVSQLTTQEAQMYQQIFTEAGIKVSSIGSPIGKITMEEDFDEHFDTFCHVLELAKIFEAPYIRMFSFYMEEDEKAGWIHEVIQRWLRFSQAAAKYPDITLLHENEKGIFGDTPERVKALIDGVGADNVKVAFDPANFLQCGVSVLTAYDLLGKEIGYVHIKDALIADGSIVPAGQGDGQLPELLQKLTADQYTGFLSLEPHLALFSGFQKLEKDEEGGSNLVAGNNRAKFDLAATALKKIIEEDLQQAWS